MTGRGSCLCGAVTYVVDGPLRDVLQCHCVRCQKTTGNFMAASGALEAHLIVEGDTLRWFHPADDPNVSYGFCATCGSSLFWRVAAPPEAHDQPFVSICAGTLDEAPTLRTAAVWFADHAAAHTPLPDHIEHIASTDL